MITEDDFRVCLDANESIDGTDYINASFLRVSKGKPSLYSFEEIILSSLLFFHAGNCSLQGNGFFKCLLYNEYNKFWAGAY